MAFLFNSDKTKLMMGEAIIKKSYTKQVTIASYDQAAANFDFSSDELYLKGYKAAGVAGLALSRLDLNAGAAYMDTDVIARVVFYNTTSSSVTVSVSIDILWFKE